MLSIMHQLTKDPYVNDNPESATEHSPKRTLTKFELQRYLDYCSEATALVGKVAALYSQSLPEEAVVSAVNEIETLTTGLSRKIWQKTNHSEQLISIQNNKRYTATFSLNPGIKFVLLSQHYTINFR